LFHIKVLKSWLISIANIISHQQWRIQSKKEEISVGWKSSPKGSKRIIKESYTGRQLAYDVKVRGSRQIRESDG